METFSTSVENTSQFSELVNISEEVMRKTYSQDDVISKHLRIILLPVIVFGGTIGNGLSIVVLLRPRMRNTTVYFYLVVLSCSDNVILYFSAFKTWIYEISGHELLHVSVFVCKAVVFILLFGWYSSSWLIVLLTVDRFAVICSPLQRTSLFTMSKARLLCAGLLSMIVLINLHVFWTFTLYTKNGRLQCSGDDSLAFMQYGFEVFKMASYFFVPFCIVLVLNCAIIVKIKRTRHHFAGQNSCHMGGSTRQRTSPLNPMHCKVTYMLLTVSFTWFLMTGPFSLLVFLGNIYTSKTGKTIIFLLMYTNHSVNFFLYCLAGRKFRRELKLLIKNACRRRKPIRTTPSKITFRTDMQAPQENNSNNIIARHSASNSLMRSVSNSILMENLGTYK